MTLVGYTGGESSSPTYESVCAGDGHTEALQIEYDPAVIEYEVLLKKFWTVHGYSENVKAQYKSAVEEAADLKRLALGKVLRCPLLRLPPLLLGAGLHLRCATGT